MKKKTITGLIAIVAILAVVIFAGCIEEGPLGVTPSPMPESTVTPITTTTPIPTLTAVQASDEHVTIVVKMERGDAWSLEFKNISNFVRKHPLPRPREGYDYVMIHFTIARIQNVHVGDPRSILADLSGREYEAGGVSFMLLRDLHDIRGDYEVPGGILTFELPKNAQLSKLKFIYPFWESWAEYDAGYIQQGEIDVIIKE